MEDGQQNLAMSVFTTDAWNNGTSEGMKNEGMDDDVKFLASSFLTYRISKLLLPDNEFRRRYCF